MVLNVTLKIPFFSPPCTLPLESLLLSILLVLTVTLKIADLVINNKKLKLNNNDIVSGKETKNSDSVVINKDNEN